MLASEVYYFERVYDKPWIGRDSMCMHSRRWKDESIITCHQHISTKLVIKKTLHVRTWYDATRSTTIHYAKWVRLGDFDLCDKLRAQKHSNNANNSDPYMCATFFHLGLGKVRSKDTQVTWIWRKWRGWWNVNDERASPCNHFQNGVRGFSGTNYVYIIHADFGFSKQGHCFVCEDHVSLVVVRE